MKPRGPGLSSWWGLSGSADVQCLHRTGEYQCQLYVSLTTFELRHRSHHQIATMPPLPPESLEPVVRLRRLFSNF